MRRSSISKSRFEVSCTPKCAASDLTKTAASHLIRRDDWRGIGSSKGCQQLTVPGRRDGQGTSHSSFDNYDPALVRVSVGGTLPLVGAFAVQADALDPKDVSVASGKVTYRLYEEETLSNLDFTSAARIYVR